MVQSWLPGTRSPFHHRMSLKRSLLSCRYNLPLSLSQRCLSHAVLSHVARLCVAHRQHPPARASPANLVGGDATSLLAGASIKLANVFRNRQHVPAHTALLFALLTSLPELHIPSTTLAHLQHIPRHQPDTAHVSALKPCKKRQGPDQLTCLSPLSQAGAQVHSSMAPLSPWVHAHQFPSAPQLRLHSGSPNLGEMPLGSSAEPVLKDSLSQAPCLAAGEYISPSKPTHPEALLAHTEWRKSTRVWLTLCNSLMGCKRLHSISWHPDCCRGAQGL